MSRMFSEILLVVLTFVIAGLAVMSMIKGEASVNLTAAQVTDPQAQRAMIEGLMHYCQGFGAVFLAGGLAYIGLGKKEDLKTRFTSKDGK
jgi:hypothetical protein